MFEINSLYPYDMQKLGIILNAFAKGLAIYTKFSYILIIKTAVPPTAPITKFIKITR